MSLWRNRGRLFQSQTDPYTSTYPWTHHRPVSQLVFPFYIHDPHAKRWTSITLNVVCYIALTRNCKKPHCRLQYMQSKPKHVGLHTFWHTQIYTCSAHIHTHMHTLSFYFYLSFLVQYHECQFSFLAPRLKCLSTVFSISLQVPKEPSSCLAKDFTVEYWLVPKIIHFTAEKWKENNKCNLNVRKVIVCRIC